jgi:hypothetical protein
MTKDHLYGIRTTILPIFLVNHAPAKAGGFGIG